MGGGQDFSQIHSFKERTQKLIKVKSVAEHITESVKDGVKFILHKHKLYHQQQMKFLEADEKCHNQ